MSLDFLFKEKDEIWKKITQISNELDELKESIPENVREAAQAKRKTSEYRNRALEAKDEAEAAADCIVKLKDSITEILSSVEEGSVDLNELRVRTSGLAKEVAQYHAELIELMESSQETISTMIQLTKERESLEADVEVIESLSADMASTEKKAKGLLNSIAVIKKEAEEVHQELYGYETQDEVTGDEIHIEGTIENLKNAYESTKDSIEQLSSQYESSKQEIEQSLKLIETDAKATFQEHISLCDKSHSDVVKRISDLLPDALTAGLASAYEAKTKAEKLESEKHNKTFKYSITGLVFISLIPFIFNALRLGDDVEVITIIKDMPYLVFAMMPLYIPVLWMAYSANKSYKLSKRLIEEYTHKGVISRTFEGLSTQVSGIGDTNIAEELKLKLLFNLVSVNSENPGKLISDYNKSDHPLMDALDKSSQMADAVVKLAKIPGFSRMARHLDEKANKVLADEENKIAGAIDMQSQDDELSEQKKALQ
ncbi:hypothetical protein [Shewanella sp. 30m-9]